MYFKIATFDPDPSLSWIIAKNPTSTFRRDLSNHDGMRVVTAEFSSLGVYAGRVTNDPLEFMLAQRAHNDANYLDAALHCVCPANLKGFAIVFRSALYGTNPSKEHLSDEDFFAPKNLLAELGPFPDGRDRAVGIFAQAGLEALVLNEGTTTSFTLQVSTRTPISVTEFLQKLYLVSTFLTHRFGQRLVPDQAQVDKLVKLCSGWIRQLECRERFVKELCGYRPEAVQAFEAALPEDAEDGADDAPEPKAVSLHTQRHRLILKIISEDRARIVGTLGEKLGYRIIDLGCADGSLTEKMGRSVTWQPTVLAIDADVRRARKRVRTLDNVRVVQGNILYPELAPEDLVPDVLILTEVIEHLEEDDRTGLLELITDTICPLVLILTTPNVEYNARMGLADGTYRHRDHRVEYTAELLQSEVINRLSACYDVEVLKLTEEDLQPSFILKATRKSLKQPVGLDRVHRLYTPFHLDAANYNVTSSELRAGAVSSTFLKNARDVFYLGPTMAPVDHDPRFPDFLEHPEAAFAYYRERGITELVAETKYMGSRGYLMLLRDPEMASRFGVSGPCVLNSRSGVSFFERNSPELDRIYTELKPRMTSDLMILDVEVLPWALKAEKLIERQFTIPGETALLARQHGAEGEPRNALAFLDVLGKFSQKGELQIRPFHLLATASLGARGVKDVKLGLYRRHAEQLNELDNLFDERLDGIAKPCEWHTVDLTSPCSTEWSISSWHTACKTGEGLVYKPAAGIVLRNQSGRLIQPALKVRGREYLRLIYGIDYLEKGWIDRLKHRNTKRKRALAVQEQELGERLLLSFLNRDEMARLSYLAAFLGIDGVSMKGMDRTL